MPKQGCPQKRLCPLATLSGRAEKVPPHCSQTRSTLLRLLGIGLTSGVSPRPFHRCEGTSCLIISHPRGTDMPSYDPYDPNSRHAAARAGVNTLGDRPTVAGRE